jgi:hypothetical protein
MSNNYNRNQNNNNRGKKPQNNQQRQQQPKEPKDITKMYFDAEERTMSFDATLSVYGQSKTGRFTFKYPSITERIRIGTLRAQMLDGAEEKSLDTMTSDLTYIVAFLRVTAVKTPDWFDLTEIDDVVGIRKIFNEVQVWVSNFRQTGGKCQRPGDSFSAPDEEIMGSDEAVPSTN